MKKALQPIQNRHYGTNYRGMLKPEKHLELVVPANARLPNAACLANGAVVVITGDVRLVDLPRHVRACSNACRQSVKRHRDVSASGHISSTRQLYSQG